MTGVAMVECNNLYEHQSTVPQERSQAQGHLSRAIHGLCELCTFERYEGTGLAVRYEGTGLAIPCLIWMEDSIECLFPNK